MAQTKRVSIMFINKKYFLLCLLFFSITIKAQVSSKESNLKHLVKASLAGIGTVIVGTDALERMNKAAQLIRSYKNDSFAGLSEQIAYSAILGYSTYVLFQKSTEEIQSFLIQ